MARESSDTHRDVGRVEYDAYRSELEASGGNPPELLLANIERHRRHYERLRDDSAVKLKLLHENRVSSLQRGERNVPLKLSM